MNLSFLPALNAGLNALAMVLLLMGLAMIRRGRIALHRRFMLAAFATSCLFLVFYITHYVWRAKVMGGSHTRYQGPWPALYYAMLLSHILLAMLVPFLALWLIRLGLRRRDALHRRVAWIGLPIWLYVSLTGVAIFFILHAARAAAPVP